MRRWVAAHPEYRERVRARSREQYAADPALREARKAKSREWYWANRERALAASTAWQKANRLKGGLRKGERHPHWKGEAASYAAVHIWITGSRGRPSICELCGTTTAKKFEWANRDHQYRRVLEDYFRACTSCHRLYDYEHGLAKKGGRRPRCVDAPPLPPSDS